MPSTYSTLKIELIPTGAQSGVWGATTNANLGTAIEQAIIGTATCVTADFTANVATYTLTDTNASQTARAFVLNVTATLTAAGTINVPAIQKPYLVFNNSVGGFAVTVKVSGQTGVSIPNGKKAWLYNTGTDVGVAFDYAPSLSLGSALFTTSGGTGQSTYTAGDLTYYASGTALTKLSIGTSTYVLTSSGTAPQWSAPSSVSVGTATNLSGGTTGSVPYQSAASTTTFLGLGTTNYVLTAGASAPQYVAQNTLSVGTATNLAGGTANQLAYQSAAGTTTFAPAPSTVGYVLGWSGSAFTWVVAPASVSAINLTGGGANTIVYQSATGTTAYLTNGTTGQVLGANTGGAPSWVTGGSNAYTRTTYTATASQTTFAVTYTVGYVQVYLNGVMLTAVDYTATSGTSVVLTIGAALNDIVEFLAFNTTPISTTSTSNLLGGTTGQVPYQSAPGATAFTGPGSTGQTLVSNGAGVPTFGTLPIAGGGTNSTATPTSGGVGYGTGTAHAYSSVGTSGQYLQSAGAGAPVWATITVPPAAAQDFVTQFTGGNTPPAMRSSGFGLI
jgi:hypothetical protein